MEERGRQRTKVTGRELSTTERAAIAGFSTVALVRSWCSDLDVDEAMRRYREGGGFELTLRAPVERVAAYMARALKPDRRLLSVAITDRGLTEVWRSDPDVTKPGPYRETPEPPPSNVVDMTARLPPKDAKAVTTVAKPVNGCPAPDFAERADARASRVLEAFLTAEQRADWRRFGGFVTVGADSGDRFMLASRDAARSVLRANGGRTLWNVDRQFAYCVHDWDVPPAEELLAMHLFLAVPGGETVMTQVMG